MGEEQKEIILRSRRDEIQRRKEERQEKKEKKENDRREYRGLELIVVKKLKEEEREHPKNRYEVRGVQYRVMDDIKKIYNCNKFEFEGEVKKNKKSEVGGLKIDEDLKNELEGNKMVVKGIGTCVIENGELVLLKRY